MSKKRKNKEKNTREDIFKMLSEIEKSLDEGHTLRISLVEELMEVFQSSLLSGDIKLAEEIVRVISKINNREGIMENIKRALENSKNFIISAIPFVLDKYIILIIPVPCNLDMPEVENILREKTGDYWLPEYVIVSSHISIIFFKKYDDTGDWGEFNSMIMRLTRNLSEIRSELEPDTVREEFLKSREKFFIKLDEIKRRMGVGDENQGN